ncbi:MAG TPA: hypothetical protein VGV69_05665 [Solirubrobacterales bacterium]|nr:hypothetical protein [Solirubrobacterales bacterium]
MTLGIVLPLGAVLLMLGGGTQVWEEVFLATAAGIVASAAWWAVFSRYAENEAKRLLTKELAEQRRVLDGRLSGLVREVEKESRQARERHFPRDVYPPQDLFDLRFNRDLMEDLERSSFYYFTGPSGVWVAARLELRSSTATTALDDVRVRMVDPTSRLALDKAVIHRKRRQENAKKANDEIEREIRDHLVLSHVALWRARTSVRGSISFSYEGRSVQERLELFEASIYDSNIDRQDQERYPLTAAWSTDHPSWGATHREFLDPDFTAFTISRDTPREELERHLVDNLELEPGDWDQWIERYDQKYLSRMERGLALARDHVDARDLDQASEVLP